jgi:hypothetical protein
LQIINRRRGDDSKKQESINSEGKGIDVILEMDHL